MCPKRELKADLDAIDILDQLYFWAVATGETKGTDYLFNARMHLHERVVGLVEAVSMPEW